jgi:hypothetical protein
MPAVVFDEQRLFAGSRPGERGNGPSAAKQRVRPWRCRKFLLYEISERFVASSAPG